MIIKTSWKVPELWFGYEKFPVEADGTVVGLSTEHRYFETMVRIFDLTIEEPPVSTGEEVDDG